MLVFQVKFNDFQRYCSEVLHRINGLLERFNFGKRNGHRGTLSLRGLFNRIPRPPRSLTAPSLITATPAASSAAIRLTRKSTWPRIVPSLASIRWIVGRGQTGHFRQHPLAYSQQGAGDFQLRCGNHGWPEGINFI